MKTVIVFVIGILIGIAGTATVPLFAEKNIQPETIILTNEESYDEGFIKGRTDGYHAAMEQLTACQIK